jgi:hypothetical protein
MSEPSMKKGAKTADGKRITVKAIPKGSGAHAVELLARQAYGSRTR